MEWISWIFGLILIGAGVGLIASALLAFWRRNGQTIQDNLRALADEREARQQAAAEEKVAQQVEAARAVEFFQPVQLQANNEFTGIALRQSGRDQHYDLDAWARMIAWLLYSRLVPGVPGQVGSVLGPTMFKTRIDQPDLLDRYLWIRLFADETVCAALRTYYNLSAAQLNERLRQLLLQVLESFFAESCNTYYNQRLVVTLFEREKHGETTFDLDFLPLLPKDSSVHSCDAYLMLASGLGQIRVPDAANHKLQFGDQLLGLSQGYFPLIGDLAGQIEIGPHAHCHIQTGKQHCAGSLVLGWRQADEVGVGGVLEIRAIKPVKGESFFLRHQVDDEQRDTPLVASTRSRLATREEGTQTTCEIWRRLGPHDNLLCTVVLRNRRPPLDSLPDCVIFERAFASFGSARDFTLFLASQIYFATKRQKNEVDILRLDSPEGQAFYNGPEGGPLFNRGRKREPLRCRLRLCLAPARLSQVHEWLGDRDMAPRLASAILDVLQEEPAFKIAFPPETLPAFKAGEGIPGLSVEIGADAALDADTVLMRALPVFVPNRRREIYGRVHFDGWAGARDRSNISCDEGLTFLTDYPSGTVALYLSRFPVYEVQAPGIFGALKIQITEPGTPSACLRIASHSGTPVLINGKTLQRPASIAFELDQRGGDLTVDLVAGERRAHIVVYAEPLAQSQEPMFVPEPAKLELHGLALHRRLERTGWDGSRLFKGLWEAAAVHEDKELRGIGQVTAQGFLAAVERGARIEHHFFAGRRTELNGEMRLSLKPGSSTLGEQPLPGQVKIWESEAANVQVDYLRLDFARNRIMHAGVLTFDYWDYWLDELERYLPDGERVARVELARCLPGDVERRDQHLYLVETRAGDDDRRGWLWHQPAGIRAVRLRSDQDSLVPCDGPLVGPFNEIEGNLYFVEWSGEPATPVSFDLPDHDEQIRHYLADGFVTLPEDASFQVGGKLGGDTRIHKSTDPIYISGKPLSLHYEPDASPTRPCLNFNPRDYANFFDKDSFRIYYSGEKRSFVIESQAHRKGTITPKTVFMVIPEGGHAILGSHALSPVKIPAGVNTLVLPGLVFRLSQGPVYYA